MKQRLEFTCKFALVMLTVILLIKPYLLGDISGLSAVLGFIILLCAFPLMSKSFKKPALTFLLLSAVIFVYTKQPLLSISSGINSLLDIIGIIIVMQLFTIPIQIGGYDIALEFLLHERFERDIELHTFITVISHLFGSFLLFATIPVMMALLDETLKKRITYHYKRFTSTAISRGYSLVVLWTPGGVNILLVLQATGLRWSEIFLPGVFLGCLGILTSSIIERWWISEGDQNNQVKDDFNIIEKEAWRRIFEILVVIASLVTFTLVLERINTYSSTSRIMTAGLIVAVVWILFYLNKPGLGKAFQVYWNTGIIKTLDLAGLFIAIGTFSKMIENSGIMIISNKVLPNLLESLGFLALVIIPLTIICFALIGIHPFISTVLIGNILSSAQSSLPSLPLSLSLAIGGAVSYTVSPFAGIVLTMAKYIDEKPVKIAFKWNGLYNSIFFIESLIFIYACYIFSI